MTDIMIGVGGVFGIALGLTLALFIVCGVFLLSGRDDDDDDQEE